jgi:hypothetical protein
MVSHAWDQHRGASVAHYRFRSMYRRVTPFVLALAALAVFGCGSAVKHLFTAPTVAFRGVALQSITPLGGRVLVNLLVRNPNPYSLSTSAMTYELFVRDTVGVARGVDTLHRTVGGHDSLLVALPLDVSLRGILAAGNAVVGYGMVPYRLVGTVTADTPIGARTIPFDQKGEFAPVSPR